MSHAQTAPALGSPQTGRVGSLTPEQGTTLDKFKQLLTEQKMLKPEHDDHLLLR